MHQEAKPLEVKVQETRPIDHVVPLLENINAPSSAYSDRKNWKIVPVLRMDWPVMVPLM